MSPVGRGMDGSAPTLGQLAAVVEVDSANVASEKSTNRTSRMIVNRNRLFSMPRRLR